MLLLKETVAPSAVRLCVPCTSGRVAMHVGGGCVGACGCHVGVWELNSGVAACPLPLVTVQNRILLCIAATVDVCIGQ